MACTTLLHPLQVERDNVDELESTLDRLRSNNTAIMDMVHSRDTIIKELNERVSVFEEDKMVLRAALRQLQREIKDEAPRMRELVLLARHCSVRSRASRGGTRSSTTSWKAGSPT